MTTAIDIEHLRQWVGREQIAEQTLEPFASVAMTGLLDRAAPPAVGEALPLPWHWPYFLDAPARAANGADGHPLRGGLLPPVPLPRRAFTFRAPRPAFDTDTLQLCAAAEGDTVERWRARETLRRPAIPHCTQQETTP